MSEIKRIEFVSRADIIAGKAKPAEPKAKPRVIEFNLMTTAQEGPLWLRTEVRNDTAKS
jgi:hypothetical protein